jgi:hypothetical protein
MALGLQLLLLLATTASALRHPHIARQLSTCVPDDGDTVGGEGSLLDLEFESPRSDR